MSALVLRHIIYGYFFLSGSDGRRWCIRRMPGASQDDTVSGIAGGVATRFAVGHTSAGRGLEYGKTKNSLSPRK
jgi:hypothetical protein